MNIGILVRTTCKTQRLFPGNIARRLKKSFQVTRVVLDLADQLDRDPGMTDGELLKLIRGY